MSNKNEFDEMFGSVEPAWAPAQSAAEKLGAFLETDNVSFVSLEKKLADLKLSEHELEMFIKRIGVALGKGMKMGGDYPAAATRKLLKSMRDSIEEAQEEEFDRLAIGLDDTLATLVLCDQFEGGKHLLNLNGAVFSFSLSRGMWSPLEKSILEQKVLDGIKTIMNGGKEEHAMIRKVIFKKKKNDDIDGLTNKVVSLIMKMRATSTEEDVLNLRAQKTSSYSVVNTLNKEIYIKKGEMIVKDHSYDSYLISQFNVKYDPEATCPTWLKMLDTVFQNYSDKDDVVRHFAEVLGYILQSKKKVPTFMLLLGSGKNGKSFVMEQFSRLMGESSTVNVNLDAFSAQAHSESALVGKNMIIDDDWKKGRMLPDDLIKKLSENKTLTANPKFKETFNFVSRCTPVILSNGAPKIRDSSYGVERRAQVFDFSYRFKDSEIDYSLDEKLADERSGFLNFLLTSYMNFLERGWFEVPASCKASADDWMRSANPLKTFLAEKCVMDNQLGMKIKAQKLYDDYREFTRDENFGHNMTRNSFNTDIELIDGLSVQVDSRDGNKYIHGLRWKSIADPE